MAYLLSALIGYLLGSSNMATYLAAFKGVNLRAGGSGNPGASNAMLLMGWRAGLLVGLHDIGKAAASVLLCAWLFPDAALAGAVAGIASVMGHMFPFYLRFHGGKGFAPYMGMVLALHWKFAIVLMLAVILVTLTTDYIVLGTMTTVVSFPLYAAWTDSLLVGFLLALLSSVIIYKHRMNLLHIYQGTEIGFRSANRGDHRVKK